MSSFHKKISLPRVSALELIIKIFTRKKNFDNLFLLPLFKNLDVRDKRFCRLIVTETIRHNGQIDKIIKKYLKKKIKRDEVYFKNILRVGVCELLFIQSKEYAAINDAVELVKNKVSKSKAGVCNALLRQIYKDRKELLLKYPIKLNFPNWLLEKWTSFWGARNVESFINLIIKEPYLDISIAGEPEIMKNILNAEPLYWKTLRKFKAGNPSSFNMYYPESIKYAWWIQDLSASIPAKLLLNQSISEIIDVCSSPGGKSAQLAASGKNITCLDINPLRIKLLEQNFNRLGLKTKNIVCDATKWTPKRSPDAILIDAPCSSTGTIRRNPDILINITKNKIIELVEIQKKLIDNSISWLKKGGIIVYCVCSLQKEEGEDQIIALLKRNKNIDILPIKPDEAKIFEKSITKEGWLRILPNSLKSFDGSDGFFICKLKCK